MTVSTVLTRRACAYCNYPLDAKSWLVFQPPCGHHCHFICSRSRIEKKKAVDNDDRLFPCEVCNSLALSETEGLARLLADSSNDLHKRNPTDVELHITNELWLGRPVLPLLSVPKAIFHLHGLRCLDLTGHPITVVPPAVGSLVSVKRLVMISLHITELPDEIGNMVALEQLFTTGCTVRSLPSSIMNLENLWELYIDGNKLESLPELLPPNIDGLKMSGNALEAIPDIRFNENIRSIRCYANRIRELPETMFTADVKLGDVLLQGNLIRQVPDTIGYMKSIRFLCLHDNLVEYVPDSLADITELRWLYMYNNRIRELPHSFLSRLKNLERLLVEGNPLSQFTAAALLRDVPQQYMRCLGVDASQVSAAKSYTEPPTAFIPAVVSGWMLGWDRLYAKLSPVTQLARSENIEILSDEVPVIGQRDVLVVAFAASQGEPEWFGVLRKLPEDISAARSKIVRDPVQSFRELHESVFKVPPGNGSERESLRKAAALPWLSTAERLPAEKGCLQTLEDFDVLSLCETNAQWYLDTDSRQYDLEAKLASLVKQYKRVIFLGTSMGGFAALSLAHLAHTVAVFGPQTDLEISHLRPGLSATDLQEATFRMRTNVDRALRSGTRIEYHVAAEDHLIYARQLRLPAGSIIVHPCDGRIARILEKAGFLAPILTELIGELQQNCNSERPIRPSIRDTTSSGGEEAAATKMAWDWHGQTDKVLVSLWGKECLHFAWATGHELSLICREAATLGDWLCPKCWAKNEDRRMDCCQCRERMTSRPTYVGEFQDAWKSTKIWPDGELAAQNSRRCGHCSRPTEYGHKDSIADTWYCSQCWRLYETMNKELQQELPEDWYVDGGQRWAWSESGISRCGFIEFGRSGALETSWGLGTWKLEGRHIDVTFGSPPKTKRLLRTAKGFGCVSSTSRWSGGCSEGWPLYGPPRCMRWRHVFINNATLVFLKACLAPWQLPSHIVELAGGRRRLSEFILAVCIFVLGLRSRRGSAKALST